MESQDHQCIINIVKNTTSEYISSDSQIPFKVKFVKSNKKGKNCEDEAELVFLNVPDVLNVVISETVKQVFERQDVKSKEEREKKGIKSLTNFREMYVNCNIRVTVVFNIP